jgi:hypothetical protein
MVNADQNTSRNYHRKKARKKKPPAATEATVKAHDRA